MRVFLSYWCVSFGLCLNTNGNPKRETVAQRHDYAALGIPKAGISPEKKVNRVRAPDH